MAVCGAGAVCRVTVCGASAVCVGGVTVCELGGSGAVHGGFGYAGCFGAGRGGGGFGRRSVGCGCGCFCGLRSHGERVRDLLAGDGGHFFEKRVLLLYYVIFCFAEKALGDGLQYLEAVCSINTRSNGSISCLHSLISFRYLRTIINYKEIRYLLNPEQNPKSN